MRSRARADAACLSNARAGVLARLRDVGRPVTVEELAELLGQHRNTIRRHLDELVSARLVVAERARPSGRGRPPLRYSVNRAALDGETEYAHLAALLATHLTRTGGAGAAKELGAEWGERLVSSARARGEEVPDALGLLEELGFAPTVSADGHTVSLRRCPLLTASSAAPDVVCVMHESMLTSLFEANGLDVRASQIQPFSGPGECRLVVGPDALPGRATARTERVG